MRVRAWRDLAVEGKERYVETVEPHNGGSCYLRWAKDVIESPKYLKMAESIKKKGILVPLVVEKGSGGRHYIWDGNRRTNMAKKIGLKS